MLSPNQRRPPQGTKPKPSTRATSTTARASRPATAAPALTTDEQKTIYALGLSIYRSIKPFELSPAELAIVQRALADAAAGKPAVDLNQWEPKIQPLGQAREKDASAAYLAKAAAAPGAMKTASGLIYRDLTPGTGPSPKPTDTVKVNYRGTLDDGTEFDSSYSRNEPAEFPLNRVVPCWTEGLQRMKVGGKAELVCPASLAYGEQGRPGIPPGAALTFQVELLGINSGAPPPPPQPPAN